MKDYIPEIKKLIASDHISEALDLLSTHATSADISKQALHLQSRLSRVQQKERKNTISHESATLERNQITEAVLELLDQQSTTEKNSPSKKNKALIALIGIASLLLAVFLWRQPIQDTSPSSLAQELEKQYEVVRPFSEGRAAVFRNSWGFVDTTGKLAIPLIYEEVSDFEGGRALARRGQKQCYINVQGQCLEETNAANPSDGMNIEFHGDHNKAIDARGGTVILNEENQQ
jgi:hypothetical protein